jgi:hypothetical protein
MYFNSAYCNEVKYSEDETEPKVNRLYKQIFVCTVNACQQHAFNMLEVVGKGYCYTRNERLLRGGYKQKGDGTVRECIQ